MSVCKISLASFALALAANTAPYPQPEGLTRMEKRYKIVVVDSQEIVREAISKRIAEECEVDVVGSAADGYSALRVCRQLL